jgi:hypothetical protein
MELIFSAVIPIFLIIALGGVAQRLNLLGENSVNVLNRFVFYFAFPPLLFIIMAEEPLAQIFNGPYIAALLIGMFGTFTVTVVYSLLVMKGSLSMASIRAQAAAFPNVGYIGLPMVLAMIGEKSLLPMGIAVILTMFVLAASIALLKIEKYRAQGRWYIVKQVALMFIINPLLVAPMLGVIYAASGFAVPVSIARFCHQLGAAAAPCALFAIGLNLAAQSIKPTWSEVLSINFFKLIFQPALTLIMMLAFHVPAVWAITGVLGAGIATAATTFMIAQQYQVLDRHISAVVFYGTVASLITLSVLTVVVSHIWPGVLH